MVWFSVGVPLLLQLVVPVALLCGLSYARASVATFVLAAAAVFAYVLAIGLAGLWLVLPWYTPLVYALLWLGVVLTSSRGLANTPGAPTTRGEYAVAFAAAGTLVALLGVAAIAVSASRAPSVAVDLMMPLRQGTYLVVNGGGHALVNAHVITLTSDRFAPYRGQSYGVDLVRVSALGLRASGLLPTDPAAYVIFGDRVISPCGGLVVSAIDGLPDLPPPQVDRGHLAGNHVIVECAGVWVVLGHLRNGSVAVRRGDLVDVGTDLGEVGNSGNSGEPHLHIHAQRPGTTAMPMSGEPVPIRLSARFLARNHRLKPRILGPTH